MKRMMVGLMVIGYAISVQSIQGMSAHKTKHKNKMKQTEQQLKVQEDDVQQQNNSMSSTAALIVSDNGAQQHVNLTASIADDIQENYASQQQKQMPNLETSSSFTKAAACTQVLKKAADKSSNSEALSTVSWGTWLDGWCEKINKNIWGHAQGVIDAIKANKFNAHNTDHVNSLNRAIDECIEGNKQQVFMDLMELCMSHEIQINSSHIDKSDAYLKTIAQRLIAIKGSFATMKKRIAENLQNNVQDSSKDDLDIDSIE